MSVVLAALSLSFALLHEFIYVDILPLFFQNDLLQLFQPFGVITKLVMLRAKNQVFFFLAE